MRLTDRCDSGLWARYLCSFCWQWTDFCFFVKWSQIQLEMDFVQCDLRNLGWRGKSPVAHLPTLAEMIKASRLAVDIFALRFSVCTNTSLKWIGRGTNSLFPNLSSSTEVVILVSCVGPIVDTVVMNPPFGTQKKGADMDFLFAGLKVNRRTLFVILDAFIQSSFS